MLFGSFGNLSVQHLKNPKEKLYFHHQRDLGAICDGSIIRILLVMPFVINFGYFFSISDFVRVDIDLSSYVTILLQVVLGMAVIFLFPMIVYILTSIGILTPMFLRTYRRHAIVVIMVVAAFITPADIISMLAAAFPLVVLYEICILMSALVYRRIKKEEALNLPLPK